MKALGQARRENLVTARAVLASLPSYLRETRIKRGQNLRDAAEEVGIMVKTFHAIERGTETNPKMDTIVRLLDYITKED